MAREAIISEITKDAPKLLTKRRKGKSVTPDIGASSTLSSNLILPIWIIDVLIKGELKDGLP